ncbi:hypothetical protein ACP6L2_11150 [Sphingobacterium lactis]|uniref:hypothetical protein n=1 Tax=Sphingobacterium lactis TaxID=797291 RepID=UPI003F7E4BEC
MEIKTERKIFKEFILLFLFLSWGCLCSCASKSRSFDLLQVEVGNKMYQNLFQIFGPDIKRYPLRYHDYTDANLSRIVITEEKLKKAEVSFSIGAYKLTSLDMYFLNDELIGFKGYSETSSKMFQEVFQKMPSIKQIDFSKVTDSGALEFIKGKNYQEFETTDRLYSGGADIITGAEQAKGTIVVGLSKKILPQLIEGLIEDEFNFITLFRTSNKLDHLSNPKNIYKKDQEFYKEYLLKKDSNKVEETNKKHK